MSQSDREAVGTLVTEPADAPAPLGDLAPDRLATVTSPPAAPPPEPEPEPEPEAEPAVDERPDALERCAALVRSRPVFSGLVGLGLVVGLALRIWALGRETINSDQATVGLMAREILHGHFFAFFWGQNYGGVEAYPVAAVFALFGKSPFTLGLTPVLLDAGCVYLVWRIGNRMFSSPVGALAAVVFWVWPEIYVHNSIIESGFRWTVLFCGLVVWLTSVRIGDGEVTYRDWVLLGLATGVGWWGSPEIVYFVAPCALFVLVRWAQGRARIPLLPFLLAIEAALVGSWPWWWHNLEQRFNSFVVPPQKVIPGVSNDYWYHFTLFRLDVLPLVLGLRLDDGSGHWLHPSGLAHTASTLLILGLCAWLLYLAVRGRALVLVLFVVGFPFLYSASPLAAYWQDGRYAVYLAPALALTVASLAHAVAVHLGRARRFAPAVAAAALLVASVGLTAVSVSQVRPYKPFVGLDATGQASWTGWRSNPNNLPTELADTLVHYRVTDAFAAYWLAYDVGFLSRGLVTVSPAGPSLVRYQPYYDEVAKSPHPAWLFITDGGQLAAGAEAGTVVLDPGCTVPEEACVTADDLVHYLVVHGIGFQTADVGPYVAVMPFGRVLPSQVFAAFPP